MGDKKDKCLKKSNFLVYQQPTGQRKERRDDCSKKGVKAPICKPRPKHIKICTGAELRKMCPPKVCPSEPVKKKSFLIFRLLGFGLKSAVAAAAIYITYDMGIWGTTDDTQELYSTACHMFGTPRPKKNTKWDPPSCEAESELFSNHPKFSPYADCENPPIRAEDSYLKFKQVWNGAVTTVFHGIANFPYNVMGKVGRSKSGESDEHRPACVPFAKLDSEDQRKISSQYK